MGSASLSASEQPEKKSVVAVQNSLNAVAQTLEEGMTIQKLHLVVTSVSEPDWQVDFTLDSALTISGLRHPKAEKGAEEDATFLVNADACTAVADRSKLWPRRSAQRCVSLWGGRQELSPCLPFFFIFYDSRLLPKTAIFVPQTLGVKNETFTFSMIFSKKIILNFR